MLPLVLLTLWLAISGRSAQAQTVQVTSNGWHTGLVIARADVPPGLLPELAAFGPQFAWFELGWGSADYYPIRDPGPLDTLRAATGSAAVMHVVGLARPVEQVFPAMEVVPVSLAPDRYARLLARLDQTFERDGPRAGGPGLYEGFSRFYPARGRFHLLHTCNTWTAETLAEASVALDPGGVRRAEEVMERLRPGASGPR